MKCPNCGHENKDSAKYCVKCGSPLTVPDEKEVQLAFLYTANKAAARRIAAGTSNKRELRDRCINWIQEQEPSLFKDTPSIEKGPLLETIQNWNTDLINMDYEERICTILHIYDGMSIDTIADTLHISQELVTKELQSAYQKVHKREDQPTIPIPEVKEDTPKKKKKFSAKKIRQRIVICLVTALVIILGVFLGVRNFASSEYNHGMEALSQEQYEEAIDSFSKAIRFGYEGDAQKQLGYAYAGQNDLENAVSALRIYYDDNQDDTDVQSALILAYEKLADQKVDDGSLKEAADWLEKEYEINPAEFVKIRLDAVNNSGLYRDKEDNEFNSYGQPLRLKNDRYILTFTYDENRHLSKIVASVGVNSLNTVYSNFDFSDANTRMNIEWFKPENEPLTWRTDTLHYNEDGSLSEEDIATKTKNYTKTYSSADEYNDSNGNTIEIQTENDDNGRISSKKEVMGSETIVEKKYSYNNDDKTYAEMNVSVNENPDPTTVTSANYTVKTKDADDCHIYHQSINEGNTEVGQTWYIPYNGTVTLYTEGE